MMSLDDYTEKMIGEYEIQRILDAHSYAESIATEDAEKYALRSAFIAGAKWQVQIEMGETDKMMLDAGKTINRMVEDRFVSAGLFPQPEQTADEQEYLNRGDR